MNLEQLRERRNGLVAQMKGILDKAETADRDLSESEASQYDSLKAEVDACSRSIGAAEQQDMIQAGLDAPRPTVAAHRMGTPPGPNASREFETLGEFMHAVRFNPNDQRLDFHEFPEQRADQSMGTGDAGGFAVPQQFLPDLQQVTPQSATFRPRAQVIPAGDPPDAALSLPALDQTAGTSDIAKTYGGVEVSWLAEGGQKPETDAKLREVTLEPQEVAGYITVTDKLLRNWRASGSILGNLLRGAVTAAEEHAFMSGDGVGKPHGVINSAAAYVVNRAVTDDFGLADLDAMISRLLMRGGEPVWLISQSCMPKLAELKNLTGESPETGDGSLVWDRNRRDSNNNQTLCGFPIIWHERSPVLGTKGDIVLADLSYYLIKDGSGPFVAASEHVHFTTNKTVVKIFGNVDGKPWLTAPLTLENGWEASPFVVLDVPSG